MPYSWRYIDITPYVRLIHTHANDVLVFVNSAAVPGLVVRMHWYRVHVACGNNTVWHLKICRHAAAATSHTSSTLDNKKATRNQQQRSIIRSHLLSPPNWYSHIVHMANGTCLSIEHSNILWLMWLHNSVRMGSFNVYGDDRICRINFHIIYLVLHVPHAACLR